LQDLPTSVIKEKYIPTKTYTNLEN